MSLIKKIKRFLGLELPHLLEDEDDVKTKRKFNIKSFLGIQSPSRLMYDDCERNYKDYYNINMNRYI